jgi:hypothetical protein
VTGPDAGAGPAGLADPARFAALVAPAVDRSFRRAMAAARDGGGVELVRRYGGPGLVGPLIEFRTALRDPDREVTAAGFAAVTRYRPDATVDGAVAGGHLVRTAGGGFRATGTGLAFLAEMTRVQAAALGGYWAGEEVRVDRLTRLLGRVLGAAGRSGGAAYAAMGPPYEPPGAPAAVVLLDRLGTLRYHRADAHAAAWSAAGLSAAEMVGLRDPARRAEIEAATDRLAGAAFAELTPQERLGLLADAAAL